MNHAQRDSAVSSSDTPPVPYRADMSFDIPLPRDLTLRVRPIRPDDALRLTDFHQRLSARSVYRRYLFAHPRLSDLEVDRFTHVDYVDRLAFVVEDTEQLIGVGRYERSPGTTEAEVAFVVADDYQHHGIGTILLERLADAAWRCGITAVVAAPL